MELSTSLEYNSSYNIIRINGEKKKNKGTENIDDNIFTNREFGKFSFDIPLNPEYCVKNQQSTISKNNGLIKIEFDLEDAKKMTSIQVDDDDE